MRKEPDCYHDKWSIFVTHILRNGWPIHGDDRDDFKVTARNPWFCCFLVSCNLLSIISNVPLKVILKQLMIYRKWMSIDNKLPNNICQKELKAIYLRLKHYTVHYYNYQTLYFYNRCHTNHSHNLDLSSIYSIHSFHQHYLDSHICKLFTQKKSRDKEMKLRVYVICHMFIKGHK